MRRSSVEVEEARVFIIHALVEDEEGEEEIVLAGEEDIVFRCPRCGTAFIVEGGRVLVFKNMDDLVKYLVESVSHLFKVKKVRVEEWG